MVDALVIACVTKCVAEYLSESSRLKKRFADVLEILFCHYAFFRSNTSKHCYSIYNIQAYAGATCKFDTT